MVVAASSELLQYAKPPQIPIRRFSVEEYHLMGEMGLLTEADRVELLEGWIVKKMIHHPRHSATISLASRTITSRLPGGWHVRGQLPISTRDSEPEPDLAIVRGMETDYATQHPGAADTGFLVEVADTSLDLDRDYKSRLYARAGIRVYWIINLVDQQIEVYTDPTESSGELRFATRTDYRAGETVPLTIDGREVSRIPVKDLLVP
jgi:Uma2 family endonuclease